MDIRAVDGLETAHEERSGFEESLVPDEGFEAIRDLLQIVTE